MELLTFERLTIAYAASLFGGHIVLGFAMKRVGRLLGNPVPGPQWVTIATGITERIVATTLVIWAPGIIAIFVGGWTAAKFAAGWNRYKDNTPAVTHARIMALIATTWSFIIAIAAGLWAHPDSIAVLAKIGTSN